MFTGIHKRHRRLTSGSGTAPRCCAYHGVVSPAEYKQYQAAHRRETWRRNFGYIRTCAVRSAAYAAGGLRVVGRFARTGAVYAVGALLVLWCGLEWWWF